MPKFTLLDGGMGRELKRSGAPFCHPYWSAQALMEAPQTVMATHQRFVDAGAEVIITNSYACVPFHLGENLYNQRGSALTRLAGKLAREVADSASYNIKVAGSLPPPMGSYRPDLFDSARAVEIYQMLLDEQAPYVDLWIAETIASLEELRAIIPVVTQSARPCHYAFTLSDNAEKDPQLRSGQSVESAVALACAAGAAGIMFNCSVPEVMHKAIEKTLAYCQDERSNIVVGVYANNFAPIGKTHRANSDDLATRELSPQEYLHYAKQWYALGARFIGGCCGIGPEHIKVLADWKKSNI
ncbi:homocysteine S-methyltransferase family protein [Salinimonas chungwhensis]|uniref:homocysteine S-methyltransferase family protein n=1 Tax=Salinimonas chungwhensis TaxID=265425 RepID=UPI00037B7D44|nr:homocysteine S-methyltransferase family protein [Salinimonas chungwhensis]